uniref:Uncharacterized protein n=1 Tax=Caenorhabditis tropicalis TaxID=1561998 RepID=A0A1I7UXU5_9PELO
MGQPFEGEPLNTMKNEMIMKALGGYVVIPFVVLSFLSGFISCFKYREWFGLCAFISLGLTFAFMIYNAFVLFYLKMKYVWPPYLIAEAKEPIPSLPITAEFIFIHFTKVLIMSITFAMFSAVSILFYCTFVLVNLSFLYKSPTKRIPRRRRPIRKLEEDVEEEEEEEENEKEKGEEEKKSEMKKTDGSKEKSQIDVTKDKTMTVTPTKPSPIST